MKNHAFGHTSMNLAWRLRMPNCFEKYRCPAKIQNGRQNGSHFQDGRPERLHIIVCYPNFTALTVF